MTSPAVDKLSDAVFADPAAQVVEAYSDYDAEPLIFDDASELSAYIQLKLSQPKGLAYVFVVYPDMGGVPKKREIRLDPKKVGGHTKRFSWDGWGLIPVQLHAADEAISNISANSENRAAKWASTYPELDPPSVWNWSAVARHTRRLKRVLKAAA